MSDFGLFEAATDAEQAPRRRERIAARQMSAALQEIHSKFDPFLANAADPTAFEDRWLAVKKDALRVLQANQVGAYPAVVREVHGSLKASWYAKHASDDCYEEEAGDDADSDFTDGGDSGSDSHHHDARRRQAGPDTVLHVNGWGPPVSPPVGAVDNPDYNSDQGMHVVTHRRQAELEDQLDTHPNQELAQGRPVSDALLVPDAYNDPANAETGGVQNDFTPGGDTGSDGYREARQLVADLYTDFAQSNNMRVASMNTLDYYAASGLHDNDYYLLAAMIRKAECDCDDDGKDDKTEDSDGGSGEDNDDGGEESHEGGSDSDSDSDDSGDDESDSDDDSGENPFAGGDDSPDDDADSDGENPFGGDDTAVDDAEDSGDQVPADDGGGDYGDPSQDQFGGGDEYGEDPAAAGPPDVGGQEFQVPEQAPDLPQDELSQLEQGAPQAVPPEVIDDILGLPPGTLEQLIHEELSGGGDVPPSGPPPGPPQQLARRKRAAEDPTQAAGDPAAAAQQPAVPAPAGGGSAGSIPPPGSASVPQPQPPVPTPTADDGALLDTALQSVTQMVDQKTQEYQQVIDPLTQALQAIQFAQQVEQAENPLDVTPPEGTVDTDPSAAPGGADSLTQQAYRIAKHYNLTEKAYKMLLTAMSRKHYEHVGEAIRTLPPELRGGIANHIGGMFHEDNPRFNNDKWLASVGVTASRRPFVIRGRTLNRGRTAGENLKNTEVLDSFEFPGQGAQTQKPVISDNLSVTPKIKGLTSSIRQAKGVLDLFDDFTKQRTDTGLNMGDAANVDAFKTEKGDKIGPKALDKLDKTFKANRRAASFFNRRVPGWRWDEHLAGYISKEARPFTCSCGEQFNTPSYGNCRCGKIWNSYAIGDGSHLAANSADMFITREIPVRDDVIVANRRMAEDRGYESFDAYGKGDTEWVEDKDREDADGPHAPGTTARRLQACYPGCHDDKAHAEKFHKDKDDEGAEKTAGSAFYALPPGEQVGDEALAAPPEPSLKDRVRDHLINKMQNGGFAGGRSAGQDFFAEKVTDVNDSWVKYDDEDPSRQGGPKKPPSTTVKGGDPKWHSREPAGKFKSTSPFKG